MLKRKEKKNNDKYIAALLNWTRAPPRSGSSSGAASPAIYSVGNACFDGWPWAPMSLSAAE